MLTISSCVHFFLVLLLFLGQRYPLEVTFSSSFDEREEEMNPLVWRHEHQVALMLGVVLGIVLGLAVGFMYDGIHYATLERWNIGSVIRWGILGAFASACVIYIQRLLRAG